MATTPATVQPRPFADHDYLGYAGVDSKAPYIAQLQGPAQLGTDWPAGATLDLIADGCSLHAYLYLPNGDASWYSLQLPAGAPAVAVLQGMQLPVGKRNLEFCMQHMGDN